MKVEETVLSRLMKIITSVILFELFIMFCGQLNFIQDDSFISLTYARNLIEGNGLVFNSGEQVEGFTSFAWIIILSIPFLFKLNPVIFAKVASIGFGAGILILTYFITDRLLRKNIQSIARFSYYSFIPVILLILSGTFYYWSVSGMETTYYTFLCLLGLFFQINSEDSKYYNLYAIITFTVAFLTRQEAAIFILVYFIDLGLKSLKTDGWNYKRFAAAFEQPVLIFAVPIMFFMVFRLYYFGYPFPNTFYAKTGISSEYIAQGMDYAITFISSYTLYGLALVLPLYLILQKKSREVARLFYLIISLYFLYIIMVGGDVLGMHRFFIPIMSLIYILFTLAFVAIFRQVQKKTVLRQVSAIGFFTVTSLVGFYSYSTTHQNAVKSSQKEKGLTYSMMSLGQRISTEETLRSPLLAASTIGALKYYSNASVLDMLGLTDEHIAHNPTDASEITGFDTGWREKKFNAEYVLSRKPDYIIFSTNEKPSSVAERALFLYEDFHSHYFVYPIFTDTTGIPRNVYKRRGIPLELTDEIFNDNVSISFVNLYNVFLNDFKRRKYLHDFNEFMELFDSLITNSPEYFAEPYRFMAQVSYNMRDYQHALEYSDTCLRIDSLNVYANVISYRSNKALVNTEELVGNLEFLQANFPEVYSNKKFLNEIGL